MMSSFAMRQAEATFRRALAAYGAVCVPVWRVQRDANGVPIGGAQKIGCVYGVRYERGQTANVLVDIPGVIARMDAPRLCCALGDTARSLQEGDGLNITGRWYTVLRADVQMGILCDVVLKEGEPGKEPVHFTNTVGVLVAELRGNMEHRFKLRTLALGKGAEKDTIGELRALIGLSA